MFRSCPAKARQISKQRCFPGFVDWRESKLVVFHCRGTASTAKECLWIMKGNLPKDQMVYWHHFNETEEIVREVDAAFPNVVFGVAPAIMKEQLDDQLEKFIRSTSSERSAIKGVPLPIMRKICESSFRRLFGHAKL